MARSISVLGVPVTAGGNAVPVSSTNWASPSSTPSGVSGCTWRNWPKHPGPKVAQRGLALPPYYILVDFDLADL
jgi:hypothetical protein